MMIIYSVFVDPIRLTFSTLDYEFYLYIDVLFDMIFMTDIVFNFFIPYYDKGYLVKNKQKIIINYLARWFLFDLTSSFPFSLIIMIMNQVEKNSNLLSLKNLLKISRIYRMIKWTSIFRLMKFAKLRSSKSKFDPDLEEDTVVVRILKFVFIFFILLHISSCLWIYIGTPSENENFTWIYFNYLIDSEPYEIYTASVYFNLVTIYTIGYGDIRPYTFWERFYNCFFMSVALILFSFSITSLSTIFERYNSLKIKLKEKLAYAKDLYIKYKMSKDLYKRIKIAIRHSSGKVIVEKFDLLDSLPEALKKEVFKRMIRTGISNYKFFINQDREFIFYVLPMLRSLMIEKNEIIINYGDFIEEMYIVDSGILSVCLEKIYENIQISQIKRNQHFGDILMYLNENCPYIISSFTSKSELMSISKSDFSKIKLAYNKAMLKILKNSCNYFYNLEKSKKVIKILHENNIQISEIKFKLKKLNNILMERNFNDIFIKDIYSQEAEDFIIQTPAKKIVQFMKTNMREKDFLRFFANDKDIKNDDYEEEEEEEDQLNNEIYERGSIKNIRYSRTYGGNSPTIKNLKDRNDSLNSEDSIDRDRKISFKEKKRRFTKQIFENISLGNMSSKLGTLLEGHNQNINANISIYKNIRQKFSQADGNENSLFNRIEQVNEQTLMNAQKEKDILNRENELKEKFLLINNNNLEFRQKHNDERHKSFISNSNLNVQTKNKSLDNSQNEKVSSSNVNVMLIDFNQSEGDGFNINKKEQINQGFNNVNINSKNKESNKLLIKSMLSSKISKRSSKNSRKILKSTRNKKASTTVNKKNSKKNFPITKSKDSYAITDAKSSKLNDDNSNNNNKVLYSSSRNLLNNESGDSVRSKQSIRNEKNISKSEKKIKKEFRKNSIYKVLKVYNYGNHINNNYIINSQAYTSRSEENNNGKFLEVEKMKNKINKDPFKTKNLDKFETYKLMCFKNHSMEYFNNHLEVKQINQILSLNDNKNISPNFPNNNSNVDNNNLQNKIDISINGSAINDSVIVNETIDMHGLNELIDENITFFVNNNFQDFEKMQDHKKQICNNSLSNVNKIFNTEEQETGSKKIKQKSENSGFTILNKEKKFLDNINLACDLFKKNIPFISEYKSLKSHPKSDLLSKSVIENFSECHDKDNQAIDNLNPVKVNHQKSYSAFNLNTINVPDGIKVKEKLKKKTINQEKAMLKLDYIYSILKVIDKYK